MSNRATENKENIIIAVIEQNLIYFLLVLNMLIKKSPNN